MPIKPLNYTELTYLVDCVERDPRGLPSTGAILRKLKAMREEAPDDRPVYVPTLTPHVWLKVATGRYVYTDETAAFSDNTFATEKEAGDQLDIYCKHML